MYSAWPYRYRLPRDSTLHDCNEAHATRHCTRSEENATTIYADEPIKSDDRINRDALASFGGYDNSGKRVKIRRAARAARQRPPSASTASKNAFKALSRKIREDPNEYEPEDSGGIPVVEQVAPPTEPKSATLDANEVAVEVFLLFYWRNSRLR
ncbi:uncharacterized protein AUP68_03276 [Ilyonectria robusta]